MLRDKPVFNGDFPYVNDIAEQIFQVLMNLAPLPYTSTN